MSNQGKNWSKKLMKASILVAGAAMTMGNQKCEQKPAVSGVRSLKKIVELGAIKASPIMFSSNTGFDFKFVANQQIYSILLDSKEFSLKYNPTIAVPPEQATGDVSFFNLTNSDNKMMKVFSQAVGKDNYSVEFAKTAWCMVDLPQLKIEGAVNSFELLGGGGLSIGFNPTGPLPTAGLASAGFNVEFAQLDISMVATRPLTTTVVAAANMTSKQTKTKVAFGLNFGAFSIGPSAYYQTPLAAVTKTALTNAVSALNTQLAKEEWSTRVMANHDTHLIIVGGANVNLEPGDQLLVYNEDYAWKGEPCNSQYLGGGAQASSAVAKIEIDWVGDEISRGRVIQQNDNNAVVGAKVKLFKLHAADYVPVEAGVDTGVSPVANSQSNAPQSSVVAKPNRG